MPESVVREELEILGIDIQGATQLRSGLRDQDHTKDRPPTPTSLYQWREGRRGITHHSVPVQVLTQLEATVIQIMLAGRPQKVFAA